MKKIAILFYAGLIFASIFLHLHQKVQIYVEAYKLSKNYNLCNDLIDRRDYLAYAFDSKTSVVKLTQWAQDNNFSFVEKKRVLALNLKNAAPAASKNKLALAFNRLLGISTASATAMAQERK